MWLAQVRFCCSFSTTFRCQGRSKTYCSIGRQGWLFTHSVRMRTVSCGGYEIDAGRAIWDFLNVHMMHSLPLQLWAAWVKKFLQGYLFACLFFLKIKFTMTRQRVPFFAFLWHKRETKDEKNIGRK